MLYLHVLANDHWMYLGLRTNTFLCERVCVNGDLGAPSQGQLVFAAAALHNITINDVGPVWCLLVNHLLIIALHALSLPLPPSLSPRFLFPLHLLLYLSGHAPLAAEWESAGRPARQHFILRVTVGVGATVFRKMKVCLCVCVWEGTGIVV